MQKKVLIVEDEPNAFEHLKRLLKKYVEFEIIAIHDSVKETITFLQENQNPDLIFMDIQLADGISFEIFEKVKVNVPVIFTTAFNEYALRAFKVSSIDYLLKPIAEQDLHNAILKWQSITQSKVSPEIILQAASLIKEYQKKYKERFLIKVGEHIKSVESKDIAIFFSEEKVTFAIDRDKRKHIIDFSLDALEELLNPELFFRINRKHIVSVSSIKDIIQITNSRLKLTLYQYEDSDLIVARERVQDFRTWLDR
jgi:two-component system LytT family response regulator